jgi:hypothetical protein
MGSCPRVLRAVSGLYEKDRMKSGSTSILNDDSSHANSGVGRHLDWTQSTALVTLLTQLRCAIYKVRGQSVGKPGYRRRRSTYLVGDHLLYQC